MDSFGDSTLISGFGDGFGDSTLISGFGEFR